MSDNSTYHPPSTSDNIYSSLLRCFKTTAGALNITVVAITNILFLLPLYIFVLYLGLQRWRQQHTGTTMNHGDLFTYHMVAKELLYVLGSTLISCGSHSDLPTMMMAGIYFCSMTLAGQMYFHLLTCVERYMAVVHPVTYLSLKKANGIRIRNICVGCVWLLSFVWVCIMALAPNISAHIIYHWTVAFALAVVSFCSFSVLRVLIHPGPGDGGTGRERVNQSKLRAFYTIMVIMGVLLFRFGGHIVASTLHNPLQLGETEHCGLLLSVFWFCVPSSLVLPLLFLQRVGKLLSCMKNNESGQGSD